MGGGLFLRFRPVMVGGGESVKMMRYQKIREERGEQGKTHCYFEINHFLSESGHFVIEAESILSSCLSSEDVVALSLLLAV